LGVQGLNDDTFWAVALIAAMDANPKLNTDLQLIMGYVLRFEANLLIKTS
jgi:hypothetical protein